MYDSGQGFKRNKKKAAAWVHRAVTVGSTEAIWWRDETRRFRKGPARCPNGWGRGNKEKPRKPKEIKALIEKLAPKYGLVRDPFNPEDNLRGGMAYLKWLLKRFKGSVPPALAGYNAGEGAVKRYGGIPPYKETQNYVRKFRRLYDKREHPY